MENGAQLRAVEVKGVDPQQESRLSALPQYVQGDAGPTSSPASSR